MAFKKFPSIEQFRNVIKDVRYHTDEGSPHPSLDFIGTIKLHGTNSAIHFCDGDVEYQSRNRILTPIDDNMNFAKTMHAHGKVMQANLLQSISDFSGYELSHLRQDCCVYGEWCGKGIQSGVGISELDYRIFVIFAIMVGDRWITPTKFPTSMPNYHIYNIHDFGSFRMLIDFNRPELVQNELVELTNAVEKQCPVANHFGIEGIGEGIVWSCYLTPEKVLRFKVKGELHSVTKVKKLASVDVEKMNSIHEFTDATVTEARLKQAIEFLIENDLPTDEPTSTGPFLKWLANDIFKEEADTMIENGLEKKDVGSAIARKGKEWFFEQMKDVA